MRLSINKTGEITELTNTAFASDYLSQDTASYLMSLISENKRYEPSSLTYEPGNNIIRIGFGNSEVNVEIQVYIANSYLTFEVISAEPAHLVDGISWGPVFTSISKTIGEVVGVVRNDQNAIGMLLLNAKTLGGMYNRSGVFEGRGSLALPYKYGSSLQAYSINRDKYRNVDAMGHTNIPLKPVKGETVVGSKIVLFSCDEPKTLDIIEEIVKAEKLPYPTIKGIWSKKAFLKSPSYMISDFRESEIDQIIDYAKRGGFFSIYHEGPFKTWGHYELDTSFFPNGITGIKYCVEKAKNAGLFFGVHTLTNFITPSDPYITPVPDQRLAYTGYGFLTANIDSSTLEIAVSSKEYFEDEKFNNLHTVKIGNELIRYKAVSENEPYKLLDCQRGAFGTFPDKHFRNDTVKKLIDHAYRVFFPDLEMQRKIAVNLARFFNETGISHLDFDGHEGCFASGEGDFAYSLFAEDFYKNLDHEVINGTSNSKPYYWYINTLCNWGEPWYGGFRESMQEYRISNQAMLQRNYFPNMLGWYMLTKNTTLPEMEWMLARAAGWNAGFAMVVRTQAIKSNPLGMILLDAINEWESARLTGAFNDEQKQRLKESGNEFHLEKVSDHAWNLYQFEKTQPIIHEKFEKQPGEPTSSSIEFTISSFEQPLQFSIEIKGNRGSMKNLLIQTDNYSELLIPDELKPGETLICNGTGNILIYDAKGKLKSNPDYTGRIPILKAGRHRIILDATVNGDEPPKAEMIIKWMGNPEKVKSTRL